MKELLSLKNNLAKRKKPKNQFGGGLLFIKSQKCKSANDDRKQDSRCLEFETTEGEDYRGMREQFEND